VGASVPGVSAASPRAPKRPFVRTLHGESVEDPWHWMRDHEDPDLVAYLSAERAAYDVATAPLAGLRAEIGRSLRRRLPAREDGCPWSQGGWTYQRRYDEGAQYPHYVRWRPGCPPETVLRVEDGDYAEVGVLEVSDDGHFLAYSVDRTGDEVYELRFRELRTGRDLPDVIERTYYGGAFAADGGSFFYTVHDETYRPYQVWRHRVGQTPDRLVLQEDDRRFELTVRRTRSGDFVIITAASRATVQEWAVPAGVPEAPPAPIRPRVHGLEETAEHLRGQDGGRWLLVTNERHPEFSLLGCAVKDWESGEPTWRELLPGRADHRLDTVDAFDSHVVVGTRHEARPRIEVFAGDDFSSAAMVLSSDQVLELGPNLDPEARGVIVGRSSLIEPTVWELHPFDGEPARVVHRTQAPGHDATAYHCELRWVAARDGLQIPVTLAYADGTRLDGSAPAVLWAYGAYESCDWPAWDPVIPEWLDRGVVYAQPHIRGGGEGGRRWWEEGHLAAKKHTFTDLVDVAEGLAAAGLVDRDRIATRGLSAGGLLQGAVFNARPDLWRIVVAEVPFVDCITSMLDDTIPLTVAEWEEWGDPSRPEDYAWMRAYTPYENEPTGAWPRLLVTGAVHDPRVLVHEPAKWVARLRDLRPEADVLFRVETGAGAHAGPAGRWAHADYEAEIMAVVLAELRAG
jgi:oligopeptidase B